MSGWVHTICDDCWTKRSSAEGKPGRTPVQVPLGDRAAEICCFCGATTRSGIYVRENPKVTKCGGKHAGDAVLEPLVKS
jgi:hypothetical protein